MDEHENTLGESPRWRSATSPMGHRSMWHHEVRSQWAGEQLYFWRLSFPGYDRKTISDTLVATLRQVDCSSYAVYELFSGGDDILLRMWGRSHHGPLTKVLREAFPGREPRIETFITTKVVTHWPFEVPGGQRMVAPAEAVLASPLDQGEIRRLESGMVPHDEYEAAQANGLLAPAPPSRGIKFVTDISVQHRGMTSWLIDQLESRLQLVVHEAKSISEKSLYAGQGFASYILMGRVDFADFYRIDQELTDAINSSIDPSFMGAKTRTSIMALQDFVGFHEQLVLADAPEPSRLSVTELLSEGESQTVEAKGSAFADVNTWLRGRQPVGTSDKLTDKGILKAIVGMLNSSAGGSIVIGALEQRRYDESLIDDMPEIGEFRCCGLEADLRGRTWDEFELQLRDTIRSRVGRQAERYLDIEPDGVERTPMAIVRVAPPARRSFGANSWFWLHPKTGGAEFWVRQGNRTILLEGEEMDDYRISLEDFHE